MIIEIFVFLITTLICYYIYVHKKIHYHFDRIGVKYLPGVPILGNVIKSTFYKAHLIDEINNVYKAFPNERYIGYIESTTPILLIRDPEIIKAITVKDFDHFVNHKVFFEDDLLSSSLFGMRDDKWKDMRTTLSPAFTGSKMKNMLPFMAEISDNTIEYLKQHSSEVINLDDIMRRFTNDVIASTAFGIEVNSLVDRDNEFYLIGQNVFNFTPWQQFLMLISTQFPGLLKMLNINIFGKNRTTFFRNLVTKTIDHRLKNKVKRPDMIQLLIEASKGTLNEGKENDEDDVGFATQKEMLKPQENIRQWTMDDLVPQVFIFFAAGFESVASTLVICIHELALNPKVQERLYQEIKQYEEVKGKLTYENIHELKYLYGLCDKRYFIIFELSETQRKWAIAIIMDRVCNKPYKLPPPRDGAEPVELQPGDIVYNMVNSLHMDPQYYPNPEVFDPDRFADENKHKICPFTFSPFGAGPRVCIASRFALMEMKVMIFKLVKTFKIVKCEKTVDPIVLQKGGFAIKVEGGSHVKVIPRE